MASIEKRTALDGATSYRVKVRMKGHPPESATFDRLTDARKWAQSLEASIREGRYFPGSAARRKTMADAIDRYLADVMPSKKASTQPPQLTQLAWWRSELGHLALADCTPARIADARDKLLKEPVPPKTRGERPEYQRPFKDGRTKEPLPEQEPRYRTPATVNRYLAVLSHLFATATREWQWTDSNPLERVTKGKESRGRVRFLSDDERDRLLLACREADSDGLYPAVVLALSTGARRSEVLDLRWPQVDFARRRIILEETKNGERRALPIVPAAMELLQDRAKVRHIKDDRVFPSDPRGAWETAVKKAGIEDFHWHDLRHSAASYLAMNGATPGEIAAVLGHKTLQMVKRYAHLSEAHTTELMERVAGKVFGGGK